MPGTDIGIHSGCDHRTSADRRRVIMVPGTPATAASVSRDNSNLTERHFGSLGSQFGSALAHASAPVGDGRAWGFAASSMVPNEAT
eukprot:883462-Rhodomonas_salina.1